VRLCCRLDLLLALSRKSGAALTNVRESEKLSTLTYLHRADLEDLQSADFDLPSELDAIESSLTRNFGQLKLIFQAGPGLLWPARLPVRLRHTGPPLPAFLRPSLPAATASRARAGTARYHCRLWRFNSRHSHVGACSFTRRSRGMAGQTRLAPCLSLSSAD
jgi:hypothetical protein